MSNVTLERIINLIKSSLLAIGALLVILAISLVWPTAAHAAVITVDPGAVVIAADGLCSLREAIENANADTAVYDDCLAGSGHDTIVLDPDLVYTVPDIDNYIDGQNGLPSITTEITIEGNGATIQRDPNLACQLDMTATASEFRIFHVAAATGTLTLNDVTIENGCADGPFYTVRIGYGGGIYNEGTVTITDSTFSNNSATSGGGIYNEGTVTITNSTFSNNSATYGGGIYNEGTVTITDSTFSDNSATSGGGILNEYGTVTITDSTFSNNSATSGGGIYNYEYGTVTITNSTFSNNSATYGGGIYNRRDTVTITNSTFSNNSATYYGGGIFNEYGTVTITDSTFSDNSAIDSGGGIFNRDTVTITNSTFSNNSATYYGGGIFNEYGTVTITDSTFSNNSATSGGGIYTAIGPATVTITDSTFSNNSATSGGGIYNLRDTVTITNSTFSDNSAIDSGGGIYNYEYGTVTITNSTFSNNSATYSGGGIYNYEYGTITITNSTFSNNSATSGGGILNEYGTVTITNSTFSNNSAIDSGGGIYNAGTVTITHSTFSDNSATSGGGILNDPASTVNIKNTIVANSPSGGNCLNTGVFNALGVNFDTDGTCPDFTQVTSAQLNLGPLQLNPPGTTETHALLPGSVAIDAAPDCTDVAGDPVITDQRGVERPQGYVCDVGAYETYETGDNNIYTITGFKWFDLDADGEVDRDEPPLGRVRITITGPVSDSTVTDHSGRFMFPGLPAGEYLLCEELPDVISHQTFPRSGPICPNGTVGWEVVLPGDEARIYRFGNVFDELIHSYPLGLWEVLAQSSRDTVVFAVRGQGIREVEVTVFDLSGRLVHSQKSAGDVPLRWELRNRQGQRVAAGVYLYVVTVRGVQGELVRSRVQKLLVRP